MQKKIYSGFALLYAILIITSCNKNFDTQPYDRISEDVVWSNKANAETFIFGTYNIMSAFASGPGQDLWTTNNIALAGTANNARSVYTETSLTRSTDVGFNNWAAIRRCNMIISKVQQSAGIADADKTALVAEGKFLRAMSYFNVARRIGRIVWIDRPLTGEDSLKLPTTANPTESYNYIIKDLEDAVAGLPATKVAGRANKYVAAAFLTEIYLQALAYKNYPAAPNVSPTDPYLDRIIANAQIVESGGYSLESDYEGMFNETKKTSPEIIFGIYNLAITNTVQNTPMQNIIPNMTADRIRKYDGSPIFNKPIPFECWPENFPSTNLAYDYLVIDKADPSKALPWNQTSQYLNAVDETADVFAPFTATGYPNDKVPKLAEETTFKKGRIKAGSNETIWTLTNDNRDARWKASIISDSSTFYGELFTTTLKGNTTRWISMSGTDYGAGASNMYWRKGVYTSVSPSFLNSVTTDYHYVCTRLGRVFLNLVEAYLLKGDVANAIVTLNKTRVFHGKLPPSTATNLNDAWNDYKRERRVELTEENDRYYSLLRWGRLGGAANNGIAPGGTIQELTEDMQVMDISKDRKSFAIFTGSFKGAYDQREFDVTRRYLFPIAQSFLDNNPNFGPQNPGW